MSELGKIEKPEAGQFAGKRKLFLVPFVFSGKDAPADYLQLFQRYWDEAARHVAGLEARVGRVSRVYCESLVKGGEEGLKSLETMNAACYRVVAEKILAGATIEATEDKETVEETIDWERCLLIGLISHKVAKIIADNYFGAMRRRYEYIARRIDETLKPDQLGLLIIQEDHMVQFPPDIEVFTVAPPALDEIRRWQRDQRARQAADQGPEPPPESGQH